MLFQRKILVTLLILTQCSFACAEPASKDTPVIMGVKTLSEQLFFSTVRIESEKINSQGESYFDISTAFIVSYDLEPGKRYDFLVTSRHSIKDALRGRFFFTRSRGGQPSLGETYTIVIENSKDNWLTSDDDTIDIAVMPLAGIIRSLSSRSWDVYYRGVSSAMSLGYDSRADLDAIEEVVLIGYPNGLFDEKNFIPVARRGITATPLSVDYGGKPQFLIDSAVFPGSSGSPVFIINRGLYPDRTGKITIGNRVIFLGMVSAFAVSENSQQENNVDIETENSKITADDDRKQRMMNIGLVYKAPVIFDVIREVLEKKQTLNKFHQ